MPPALTFYDATLELPATPSAPPTDGPALPDRYLDQGRLGAGAVGEVRRVYDRVLEANLAMKILQHTPSSEAQARFWGEARVMARLAHPGIVAVQDLGTLPDGRPWFTMEEVQGRTFTELIREGTGGLRRRVDVFLRICEAVAYAHAQGVVHRDLKPDNVMVGEFGEVRVMDWGLARILGQLDLPGHSASVPRDGTSLGSVLGTPGFMPPEQAEGRSAEVGPPADVYALGAMLYLILSGSCPYAGLPGQAALEATLLGPPRPILLLAPETPPPLLELCEAAMARLPSARPPHAGAVATLVRDWLEGARKEAEARQLLEQALLRAPEVERLLGVAQAAEAEAAIKLENVAPSAPVEEKLAEVCNACRILGFEDVRDLGFDDDDILVTQDKIEAIADVIREVKPDVLITHHPYESGGFKMHGTIGQCTL
ncbi:MAG TPA: protein kinase, partial [Myxococcota bacterium]|nr:protein kinase [Myxococcota bacterium]